MRWFTLNNFPLENKTVFLRVDYNVPLETITKSKKSSKIIIKVSDNSKIKASLPTLNFLLSKNCTIILATHLGEPKGKFISELKTDPLVQELQQLLPKVKIKKLNDCIGKELKAEIQKAKLPYSKPSFKTNNNLSKQIFLLENLRFYKEEEENDFTFAHSLADLAEIYINDAFAVSHRKHASVSAITNFLPALAGFLMEKEVTNLSNAFSNLHPTVWLMGGAKLDKIELINQALKRADKLLIGGALAFTFLKAQGINVGMSKFDSSSLELAKKLLSQYPHKVILPADFIISEEFKVRAKTGIVKHNQIKTNQIALDIGPETIHNFQQYLIHAKLIVWNGPLGYFEWAKFAHGTKEIARFLGKLNAIKLAGGGETAAAIHKFGLEHNFTHLSTGGGASLEFLSGKKLPGIEALEENWKNNKLGMKT